MTEDFLEQERKHLDALLQLTPFVFTESHPIPSVAQINALAGWRFTTGNQTAQADIYVFDQYEQIQTTIQQLMEKNWHGSGT